MTDHGQAMAQGLAKAEGSGTAEGPVTSGYHQPSPFPVWVEARIARQLVARTVVVGPLLVLAFGLTRGTIGAASAAAGVLIVAGNFLLFGYMMSKAASVSLSLYHAAALLGFFVRLGLITAAMLLAAWVFEVDRLAMGVAAVIAYFVLLTWEAWALTRRKSGREYEWTG